MEEVGKNAGPKGEYAKRGGKELGKGQYRKKGNGCRNLHWCKEGSERTKRVLRKKKLEERARIGMEARAKLERGLEKPINKTV